MSLRRLLLQRIVLGLVAAWTVLTLVFALFTLTDDWVLGGKIGNLRYARADDSEIALAREQYLAARGLDRPVREQYVDWMGDMLTLEWGTSFATGEAVVPLVASAVARTALYVVPAIGAAIGVGVLVGLWVALRPDSRLVNGGLGTAYLLFALPNFWIGGILLSTTVDGTVGYSPLVFEHALPIALTATTLLGGYASYARAHALEYATADFVKLVEAKGASRRRVAKHVLHNAAIPVFSMLFTEALGLLVLAVFVIEVLFGIDGFGLLLFDAVDARDLPVLLGGTMTLIAVGVLGNVVQDLSYSVLDPRVDTGTR